MPDGDVFMVRVPVRHRRNGRQMALTHGDNGPSAADGETNGALASALAKAYRWQEQVESGEYPSLEDLAAVNSVDRTYVGRILRLTSLAPEIVGRIPDGDEPEGVSLRRLQKAVPALPTSEGPLWQPRAPPTAADRVDQATWPRLLLKMTHAGYSCRPHFSTFSTGC